MNYELCIITKSIYYFRKKIYKMFDFCLQTYKNLANKLKKLKKSVVRLAFYYEKNLCKIMI